MKDEKRSMILDAATKIFAEKGYQYATISEVAKEAGISTGLLYSYFKNKL
ncbi:MAG: helix-turn-helix transcriptional regulator, partial [Deltaproteobacteria bacterium]|nr:helix-turn-helix transcriptional regulator [Deltaproteobacteria bacterium]